MQAAPKPLEAANDGMALSEYAVGEAAQADPSNPIWLTEALDRLSQRLRTGLDAGLVPLLVDGRHYRVANLVRQHGPLSQVSLSDYTRIDRASMVKLIDHLESVGWVTREMNAADRRRHAITLTAQGRKALLAADDIAGQNEEHVLARLSASDRAYLSVLVRDLKA